MATATDEQRLDTTFAALANAAMSDTASTTASVRIERRFAAPVELIWTMRTDPEAFARWYGPPGARVSVAEMDVRVGGRRHVSMETDTPTGLMQLWFAGSTATSRPPPGSPAPNR